MRSRVLVAAIVAIGITSPVLGVAGPSSSKSDPRFAARALAEHGYALYEAGKYPEAIEALERAVQVYPAPTLLFALGRANATIGKLVEARAYFQRVTQEKLAPDASPAFEQVHRDAPGEVAALDKRIPTITIRVRGAGGKTLRVRVDDIDVQDYSADRPERVNPGQHRVSAVPLGGVGRTRLVDLAEGAHITVELGLEEAMSPIAPSPPRPPWRVPAYVLFGVGGASLLFGAGAAVYTGIKSAELNAACPTGKCLTPEHDSDIRLGRAMGASSTAAFIVGGVGVVIGTTLLLIEPSAKPAAAISVGPASIELRGVF